MANRSHPVITPDRPEMADSLGFDPEGLSIFLDELRGAGYNLGVEQYVAVNNLVLVLVTQGDWLRQPEKLASFIGPIVCSNAREQEDFQIRFQRWLPALMKPEPLSLQGKQPRPELLTPAIKPALSRSRWLWGGLAFGLLLALAIVGEILSNRSQDPPDSIPIPSVAPLPSISPTPVPTPDTKNIDIPTWQIALAIFGILSGMTFLVWRSWWQWRAKLFLNRYATNMDLELEAVSFPAIEQELFPRLVFLHIAQRLRQRVSLTSPRIAIQPTITQSLRQGGWFTPVYGQRQEIPEYLVLIDRSSYGDHQARLVTEILNCFVDNQVLVKHFYFNDSPQICTPEKITEPPQSLKELAAHYFQHRLLIFAQAEQFFDPLSGELEPWVQRLETWSDRAIFTPKALDQWGYSEFKLGSDFLILPATPEGLKCLIPSLNDRKSSLSTHQKRSLLPRSLRHYPQRWVERYPVDDQTVTEVFAALKRYLGEDGFFWLSACAIFPEVQWPITLYLGNTLENGAGQKLLNRIPLIELVALPWFRWGYMPDWFRLKLIQGLSPDSDQQIRNTFRKLLTEVFLNDDGQLKLHIAEQKSPDFLKQFTEFLLQTFAKQEIDRNPFKDQIFVEFMTQKRSILLLELPQTQQWRDWLKTPTKVGRWLLVFLGLSAVTAGLTFLARRQPFPLQTAQQTPTPTIQTTATPTPTIQTTATPTPTIQTTSSPIPTIQAIPSPTSTIQAIPSPIATIQTTPSPTPTIQTTPSPTPTIQTIPSPTPTVIADSLSPAAQAQDGKQFYCDLTGAVPTTKVIEENGTTRNLIRWTNTYWSDKGDPPEKRCQIFSNTISNVYQSEGSFLLGVGTMNRIPVICVTEREPGYGGVYPCRIHILTLAPGEDGQAVLQQFRENQTGGGPGIERNNYGPFIIE